MLSLSCLYLHFLNPFFKNPYFFSILSSNFRFYLNLYSQPLILVALTLNLKNNLFVFHTLYRNIECLAVTARKTVITTVKQLLIFGIETN